jgi:hypothetical protein
MASDRKILDGRRVIVADDEPFNLSIIIRMMRELGCQDILSAATGGEALHFGLVGAAMALDVDAFIIKPVSLQAMAGRLEKVFGQRAELKDKADYERIDIEAVSQRLLSRKPVGLARPKTELKKAVTGIPVRLDAVKPGAILSEDVRSPNGELLLGKATMLTERLIRRLVELQTMLKLEYVYVFPPAQAEKSGDKAV